MSTIVSLRHNALRNCYDSSTGQPRRPRLKGPQCLDAELPDQAGQRRGASSRRLRFARRRLDSRAIQRKAGEGK